MLFILACARIVRRDSLRSSRNENRDQGEAIRLLLCIPLEVECKRHVI